LVETSDGGYIIAGYTQSFGAGDYDFCLIKTDELGNMEWNQTYGGTGKDYAYSLVETSDGGYVLAGTKDYEAHQWDGSPVSGDCWLVKTDAFGSMEWNRTYGGKASEYTSQVVTTSDGGYVLASTTYSFGAGAGDFWVIKTDEYGVVPELHPPYICVSSPQNITYNTENVSLTFTVNEETSWIGYSVDGQNNVTITEKTLNITELANGKHNITVYATDTAGNTGTSGTIYFTVETAIPAWIIISIATVAVIVVATLLYFRKTKKNPQTDPQVKSA
jgi:hypothetical protein